MTSKQDLAKLRDCMQAEYLKVLHCFTLALSSITRITESGHVTEEKTGLHRLKNILPKYLVCRILETAMQTVRTHTHTHTLPLAGTLLEAPGNSTNLNVKVTNHCLQAKIRQPNLAETYAYWF